MPVSPQPDPTLRVADLAITVGQDRRTAVRGVDFQIARGESVGWVGESGSGKTLTCRAVLGLLPPGCELAEGSIRLGADETDLTRANRRRWDRIRGTRLAAVFQDPASYLN